VVPASASAGIKPADHVAGDNSLDSLSLELSYESAVFCRGFRLPEQDDEESRNKPHPESNCQEFDAAAGK